MSAWMVYALGLLTLPALSGAALLALKTYWTLELWANRHGCYWGFRVNGCGPTITRRQEVRLVHSCWLLHSGTYAHIAGGARFVGVGGRERWALVLGWVDDKLALDGSGES